MSQICPEFSIFIAIQVLALGFLLGCTFAPNLKTFTGKHVDLHMLKVEAMIWNECSYALPNSVLRVRCSTSLKLPSRS